MSTTRAEQIVDGVPLPEIDINTAHIVGRIRGYTTNRLRPYGIACVEEALAKSGWQPIATAPKDGTLIDLWRPSCGGERLTDYRWIQLWPGNGFFEPTKSGPTAVRDATRWMLPPQAPGD